MGDYGNSLLCRYVSVDGEYLDKNYCDKELSRGIPGLSMELTCDVD